MGPRPPRIVDVLEDVPTEPMPRARRLTKRQQKRIGSKRLRAKLRRMAKRATGTTRRDHGAIGAGHLTPRGVQIIQAMRQIAQNTPTISIAEREAAVKEARRRALTERRSS